MRPPQPDREMVHRGSPADADEHQRRTHVRIEDGQLADAYWYRKSRSAQLLDQVEKSRSQLERDEREHQRMVDETARALAAWTNFRRSNDDILTEPVNA